MTIALPFAADLPHFREAAVRFQHRETSMSIAKKGLLVSALVFALSGAAFAQGAGGGGGGGGGGTAGGNGAGQGGTGMGTPNANGVTGSTSGASGANTMGNTGSTHKSMKKKGNMASPASGSGM
jgi:hypothetical protein